MHFNRFKFFCNISLKKDINKKSNLPKKESNAIRVSTKQAPKKQKKKSTNNKKPRGLTARERSNASLESKKTKGEQSVY
jgi:hypothetical protein